jgi:hypothetical protein
VLHRVRSRPPPITIMLRSDITGPWTAAEYSTRSSTRVFCPELQMTQKLERSLRSDDQWFRSYKKLGDLVKVE